MLQAPNGEYCMQKNTATHARNELSRHAKSGAGASIGARGKKEKSRGTTVITHGIHDWEAAWHAYVECQLSENGKCVSEISLPWQICKRHFKNAIGCVAFVRVANM